MKHSHLIKQVVLLQNVTLKFQISPIEKFSYWLTSKLLMSNHVSLCQYIISKPEILSLI